MKVVQPAKALVRLVPSIVKARVSRRRLWRHRDPVNLDRWSILSTVGCDGPKARDGRSVSLSLPGDHPTGRTG